LYLLDTDIVSADAPTKRLVGVEAFAAWVRAHGDWLRPALIKAKPAMLIDDVMR
jgi:hypothetical protein